jgi:bisphosphoglycerate-dependent phosphoglycerate mutase
MLRLFIITLNICALAMSVPLLGNVYGNTKLSSEKIFTGIRKRILAISGVAIAKKPAPLHAVTDHNFRKQFTRSKLARGSALSPKCNSRCSAKTPCNKRCQLARDKYQLQLAKTKYKKDNVKNYTSSQLNQRYYSSQVTHGACNSRCKAAKALYQKQRTQYMKTFHVPCQNGHIKNKGTTNGKSLSDQGNPSGDTPGDKTTIGGYGGVSAGRPLGAPGAGQINWPNNAKYNWRTECETYTDILGKPHPTNRPTKHLLYVVSSRKPRVI